MLKCQYCKKELHVGLFCSKPCEHKWFKQRLKRRTAAYKRHWTAVLENDFNSIFCKQAQLHDICMPVFNHRLDITHSYTKYATDCLNTFVKTIEVATTEELRNMNANMDDFQQKW